MAWLSTMSLCTLVTTRFIRYLRVTSVNGLALQNESVYLSGCWDQSLSGNELTVVTEFNRYMNDVSKWPVSSPGV